MKNPKPPPPEETRLLDVLYCVREGLRKLVPAAPDWGHPPFTHLGTLNSHHGPDYDPDAPPYLVVSLRPYYSSGSHSWTCQISIADGDDFLFQRFRDFTWPNWCEQLRLYDQITRFDRDLYDLLAEEGFD